MRVHSMSLTTEGGDSPLPLDIHAALARFRDEAAGGTTTSLVLKSSGSEQICLRYDNKKNHFSIQITNVGEEDHPKEGWKAVKASRPGTGDIGWAITKLCAQKGEQLWMKVYAGEGDLRAFSLWVNAGEINATCMRVPT